MAFSLYLLWTCSLDNLTVEMAKINTYSQLNGTNHCRHTILPIRSGYC
jgi:hypothetical protein